MGEEFTLSAQLDQIPRLWADFQNSATATDSSHLSKVLLLFNTKDFGQLRAGTQTTPSRTTIQVINPTYPSIPKWFIQGSNTDFFHTSNGSYQTDFYTGVNINADNTFSYCRFETSSATNTSDTSFVVIDMTTLAIKKTLHSSDIHIPGVRSLLIDGHDYQVDAHGNQLLPILVDTVMNTTCLPGGRTVDTVAIGWIVLLDSNNNLIWAWNPLDHGYSICEARYTIRNSDSTLDWSHCNSARFGMNGNIQVSFREVGVFEFDPTSGHIAFKLGGLDSLGSSYIRIPDSANYYYQHDWVQLDSFHYSVYSDGAGIMHYLAGQTYYVNKDSMIARLEEKLNPISPQTSIAMGSFRKTQRSAGTPKIYSVLNHGITIQDYINTAYSQVADIEDSAGNVIEELVGPAEQVPYRMEQIDWQIPNRPSVYKKGTELVDTIPHLYGYRWYQIHDTSLALVDTGSDHYAPTSYGIYCLEALFNTGPIVIHMVSEPIGFFPAGLNMLFDNDKISVFPNPFNQQLIVTLSQNNDFEITSLCGQTLKRGHLQEGENVINMEDLTSGIYIFKTLDPCHMVKLIKFN